MQKHWSCPWGVAAVVSKLGLQLSYAVKQKQEVEELGVGGRGAMCCNQASDEPTGEFLGIKCRGAPPGRTLSPSGFHFGAILVSWGGQSGTVSPKERRRA